MICGKKNLLTVGCSFTEGHYLGKEGSWGYYLSKFTNTNFINKGSGGASNEFIMNRLLEELELHSNHIKDDVFVIVQWSECMRSSVYYTHPTNENLSRWHSITPQQLVADKLQNDNDENVWLYENKKSFYPFYSSIEPYLHRTYSNMLFVKNYLENNNIPYLFFDGINNHKLFIKNEEWYLKASTKKNVDFKINVDTKDACLINPLIIKKIYNSKNFFNELDISMNEWLYEMGETYSEGNEGHPNELGSSEWAKILLKYINNNLEI